MTDKDYDKLKQIEEAIQAFNSKKLHESNLALYTKTTLYCNFPKGSFTDKFCILDTFNCRFSLIGKFFTTIYEP